MKKRTILLAFLGLVGILGSLFLFNNINTASALTTSKVINSSVFRVDTTVDINNTINGDVYVAGQTVKISGTVNGDVLVAAQNITVNAQVNGSVRLLGQNVTINGKVANSVSVASQSFYLNKDASIGNDLIIAYQSANIDGKVKRDVYSAGSDLLISGQIGRNLTYSSNKDVNLEDGYQVTGKITHNKITNKVSANYSLMNGFIRPVIYFMLALALVMLVACAVAPKYLADLSDVISKNGFKTFLCGFLTLLVMPAALVLVSLTVIGMPLAFISVFIWISLILVSFIVSAYFLGKLMLKSNNSILVGFIGSLTLTILLAIPYLNFFVAIVAISLGAGSIMVYFIKNGQIKK